MALTGQLTIIESPSNTRAVALGQGDLDHIIDSLKDCGWVNLAYSFERMVSDLSGDSAVVSDGPPPRAIEIDPGAIAPPPTSMTTHTVTATLTGGDAETHAAARDAITDATGVAPDDQLCALCKGSIHDHVDVAEEGPHGEEVFNYRCLIAELSDVISDMETCEPPVETEWVITLKLVHKAYQEKLDHG